MKSNHRLLLLPLNPHIVYRCLLFSGAFDASAKMRTKITEQGNIIERISVPGPMDNRSPKGIAASKPADPCMNP